MAELKTSQNDILTEDEIMALFPRDGGGLDEDGGGVAEDVAQNGGKPAGTGKEEFGGDAEMDNDPTKGEGVGPNEQGPLFGSPESVGGEDDGKGKGDAGSKTSGASPTQNVYSSIARALVDDGIFLNPDEINPDEVNDSEKFAELFESEIRSRLDERQRRVDDALGNGVPPDEVRVLEERLAWLKSIKDENVKAENQDGEQLRRWLIYNDWLNHGYDKERAKRETEKSFKAGLDVEDAKLALKSNIETVSNSYQNVVEAARKRKEDEQAALQKEADDLHREIIDVGSFIGGINVDGATRRKIFDNLSKPVWTEPESGERFTALQRYEFEHRMEFLKNVSLFYTLTNGFKDIEGLVKDRLRQERKSGIDKLESMLGGASQQSGEMSMMGAFSRTANGVSVLPEGWRLSD